MTSEPISPGPNCMSALADILNKYEKWVEAKDVGTKAQPFSASLPPQRPQVSLFSTRIPPQP